MKKKKKKNGSNIGFWWQFLKLGSLVALELFHRCTLGRNPVNALILDVTMVGNEEEEVNLTDVTLVSDDNFLN